MYVRACDDQVVLAWPNGSDQDSTAGERPLCQGKLTVNVRRTAGLDPFFPVQTFFSEATPQEKIAALRRACKRHVELTKECSKGLGQDRCEWDIATPY
jgi:hypothetical protein